MCVGATIVGLLPIRLLLDAHLLLCSFFSFSYQNVGFGSACICGVGRYIVKYCYNELYIIICSVFSWMYASIFEAFENSNSTGRAVHLCGGRCGDMLSGHWFPPHFFRTAGVGGA